MSKNRTKQPTSALGQALRFYRGGMSLQKLDGTSGIQRWRLTAYERGTMVPEPETLQRIAAALDVKVPAIHALAAVLEAVPEVMDRGATPEAVGFIQRSARLARCLRVAEAPLVPAGLAGYAKEPLHPPANAAVLWERLRRYTPAQRRVLVQEVPAYQVVPLSVLLCDESLEAAAEDPAKAQALARLAELIAERVPGSDAERSRLRGFCALHVGSAQRAGGNLHAAQAATDRAEIHWTTGSSGDPEGLLDPARCLGLKASLRRAQGDLPGSLNLLRQAVALGSSPEIPYLLLNLATTFEAMGDHEAAITSLHEAEQYLGPGREPRLLLHQRFNLAVNLLYLERYKDAEDLLPEIRRLSPPGVSRTRLTWLEGAVAAGLGRVEEAEVLLLEVKGEFLELRNAFDAALVSLDLAALYLRQNRTAEVKKLATGMVKTFLELKVHKEALRAARLFQEAAVREQATVALVGRLAAYLRRAQLEVALRFGG